VFTLVVPFHSDADRLSRVFAAADAAAAHGVTEILFCHNGGALSPDARVAIEKRLPAMGRLLHTDVKGIGAGYRLGITEASTEFVVLSASDLPFGFSDLESFVAAGKPSLAIGSKAHPGTKLPGYSPLRRTATHAFWLVRRILLGPSTPRDSQGTIIARTALAKTIGRDVRSDDYFFSLELLTLCIRAGETPVELPVRFEETGGKSSVRLVHDTIELVKKTWRLRRRLR
jgi:dolichyl-phosphate beta-glucosyltransferase